jgi:hypothetical protein
MDLVRRLVVVLFGWTQGEIRFLHGAGERETVTYRRRLSRSTRRPVSRPISIAL